MDIHFDDNGERVQAVEPDAYNIRFDNQGYPCPDGIDSLDESAIRRETIAQLLQFLAAGQSPVKAGMRVMILAHLLGQSGCRTDSELAKKLNITKGRVSQLRSMFTGSFQALAGLNSRNTKP